MLHASAVFRRWGFTVKPQVFPSPPPWATHISLPCRDKGYERPSFCSGTSAQHKMGKGAIFSPAHESWRKHPMLNPKLRHMFPGFGYAVAIFSTYCAGEWFYNRMSGKKGGHH